MSLVWKKWKNLTEEGPPSPVPLTSSNSADTVENYCPAETSAKRVVELPSPTPVTPQGLRPRRSVSSISQELKLYESTMALGSSPSERRPRMTLPPLSVLSSPVISTSSFYSDGGRLNVAESPVLLPGQARTAVGALVAASHAKTCDAKDFLPFSAQSSLRVSSTAVNVSQQSILPPFDENEFQKYLREDENARDLVPPLSPLVSPYKLFASSHPGQSALAMMSPDMVESCRSPGPVPLRFGAVRTPERPIIETEYEATSPVLSVNASPSSMTEAFEERVAAASSNPRPSLIDDADAPRIQMGTKLSTDAALQQRKSWHQRRAREDLFLAVFERLQDDMDSVYEIDRQEGELVVCAAAEGLLTGLLPATRSRIVDTLSQLLVEMEVTEELFLSSPTDIAAVAVPHCDLRDTLQFCLQLVRVAPQLPPPFDDQRRRWRLLPGVKAALGLIPESPPPEHRGGDTSVFSLPCDDSAETPMTSNVSLTTTITSRSPDIRGSASQDCQPQHPALEVRRAIARASALLDRLSSLLLRDDQLLPAQDLKRTYAELQTLDAAALRAAVESFELEASEGDEPLVELLSDEREEAEEPQDSWGIIGHPHRDIARSPPRPAAELFFSPLQRPPAAEVVKPEKQFRWWAGGGSRRRFAARLAGNTAAVEEGRDAPESPRRRGDALRFA